MICFLNERTEHKVDSIKITIIITKISGTHILCVGCPGKLFTWAILTFILNLIALR